MSKPWMNIDSAPKDGTKIIAWLEPNEFHAPHKGVERVISWETRQFKTAAGESVGEPFGLWISHGGTSSMSLAPTKWLEVVK